MQCSGGGGEHSLRSDSILPIIMAAGLAAH